VYEIHDWALAAGEVHVERAAPAVPWQFHVCNCTGSFATASFSPTIP
jgi:hypothetical protein